MVEQEPKKDAKGLMDDDVWGDEEDVDAEMNAMTDDEIRSKTADLE